ncbi:MAG: hypothetical protein GF346_06790 [Candidatus Eisenbacteria bacterium]|nr:hypothetical protein [Candidatus Latescibacterota bacterium]MBD3302135.1 hypothetical protein [Candidatus Eisenbacteria bacterium]
MDLYIVRHAIAFDRDAVRWPDDAKRPLTEKGVEKFRKTARGCRALIGAIDRTWSSPYVRAWDTARLLEEEAGWPAPIPCDPLTPDGTPGGVLDFLRAQAPRGSVAVVGHEPMLHELISLFATGHPGGLLIEVKKGGVARLTFPRSIQAGHGILRWHAAPKLLRGISG